MRTPTATERSRIANLMRRPVPDPRLGKAHSLASMLAGCNVNPSSGCWLWRGAGVSDVRGKGGPRVWAADPQGVVRVLSAGRVAWLLAGLPIEEGEMVCRATCFDTACINPCHGCACTPLEKQRMLADAGRFESPERTRNLGLIAARRALAPELVRKVEQLIAENVPRSEIAIDVGISMGTVKRIRAGRHIHSRGRQALLPGASVFAAGRVL